MLDHDGDVTRIGVVEELPRPLVEHVGVDAVGLEEGDAALPARPLGLHPLELAGEIGDLPVKTLARLDAVLAGVGVDTK